MGFKFQLAGHMQITHSKPVTFLYLRETIRYTCGRKQ